MTLTTVSTTVLYCDDDGDDDDGSYVISCCCFVIGSLGGFSQQCHLATYIKITEMNTLYPFCTFTLFT